MVTDSLNHDMILLQKGGDIMRESKLNLIGRDLNDINREFQMLLTKISADYAQKYCNDEQIKKHWNSDLDGWVNWLESLKVK
jgi:hypothetical protein